MFYDDSKRTPSGYLAWRLRTVVRNLGSPSTSSERLKRKNSGDDNDGPIPKKKNVLPSKDEEENITFLKYACPSVQRINSRKNEGNISISK